MPTYVYESIPTRPGESAERFELRQGMTEPPYSRHPVTGHPVRRVIVGGAGLILGAQPGKPSAKRAGGGCGCGPGCGCG